MENNLQEIARENEDVLGDLREIQMRISDRHERIRERALAYTYHLMTAIGLITGFGFTAINSVQSLGIFFVGEFFLLAGMALAMWFAKAGFIDELKDVTNQFEKVHISITDRIQMRHEFTESANPDNINKKMAELKKADLSIFKDKTKVANYKWLGAIFCFFICGGLFLLISFTSLHCYIRYLTR